MIRPENLRNNRWQVKPAVPHEIKQTLGQYHPVLQQVLYNRGLQDSSHIQAFIEGRYLESTDPFLLPDMDKAMARIRQAIEQDEIIVVYGDFDADGVTSTVLLTQALRGLGLSREQAQPHIPDRFEDGYGLNEKVLTMLKKDRNANLVISVDCGIRSIREVEHANKIGLDMIITDHHSLGRRIPPALAVINPKRTDSTYPEEMLAGVGIAYKMAQALRVAFPDRAEFDETDFLDLVAVGTVADLAPLQGENRKLVMDGLKVINSCQRPGLAALARVSGLKPGSISAESIAFALGPRINAAGRLAHAHQAAKLLALNNFPLVHLEAHEQAVELNDLNQDRQQLTAKLTKEAEAQIDPESPLLFAADPDFAPGVVGLVAGRLTEKYYRPSIIVEQGETESRGSCRSIPEFHITNALDQVQDLLVRHGGHAQAAGFTINNENLPEFRERMIEIAATELAGKDLYPTLTIDAEIDLMDVDWALQNVLEELEPTGEANDKPIFMSRNVRVYNHRAVGQDGAHLQLEVGDDEGRIKLRCIAFRQGAWANNLPDKVDLAYMLGVNEWRGRRTLQLMVQDIRVPEPLTENQ
ncbi:MAG: single-stranded-DNA-specific exonuclease RecJ [Candidatus Promineifilaceae bacterium]